MIRTVLFILATWGVILAASVGSFLGVRRALPDWHVGICLGEWIARLAGMFLFPRAGTDQDRNE